MQRLTFTNKNNQSIEIGTNRNCQFLLNSITGTEGVSLTGTVLDERMIQIDLSIMAKSEESIFDLRSQITNVFNPLLGEGSLLYEFDGKTYQIETSVDIPPAFPSGSDNRLLKFQKATIFLICVDPLWKETSYHLGLLTTPSTPLFKFPFSTTSTGVEMGKVSSNYTIYNSGDVSTPLILEFDGGIEHASLLNKTTGEIIRIIKPIQSGYKLFINTEKRKKQVTLFQDNNEKETAYDSLSSDSCYMQLITGINELEFKAKSKRGKSNLSLKWKNRYLGI